MALDVGDSQLHAFAQPGPQRTPAFGRVGKLEHATDITVVVPGNQIVQIE